MSDIEVDIGKGGWGAHMDVLTTFSNVDGENGVQSLRGATHEGPTGSFFRACGIIMVLATSLPLGNTFVLSPLETTFVLSPFEHTFVLSPLETTFVLSSLEVTETALSCGMSNTTSLHERDARGTNALVDTALIKMDGTSVDGRNTRGRDDTSGSGGEGGGPSNGDSENTFILFVQASETLGR
jgi:hypothetical protein